jgi:hypothetical protein
VVIYVLLVVAGVCVLGAALMWLGRSGRSDEIERFHRARQMTTEWSRRYAATGRLELPATAPSQEERQPEPAHR